MRKAKFRIWNNRGKKWVGEGFGLGYRPQDVVMQWTGLKDSKGKDIYEGDIVKLTYVPLPEVTEILEVRWGGYDGGEYVSDVECWMVGKESLSELLTYQPTYGHNAIKKCEVIGNVFENPSLAITRFPGLYRRAHDQESSI